MDILLKFTSDYTEIHVRLILFTPKSPVRVKEHPYGKYKRANAKRSVGTREAATSTVGMHAINCVRTQLLTAVRRGSLHTENFFRNLIKSTKNQIVITIFRLIWNHGRPFG